MPSQTEDMEVAITNKRYEPQPILVGVTGIHIGRSPGFCVEHFIRLPENQWHLYETSKYSGGTASDLNRFPFSFKRHSV